MKPNKKNLIAATTLILFFGSCKAMVMPTSSSSSAPNLPTQKRLVDPQQFDDLVYNQQNLFGLFCPEIINIIRKFTLPHPTYLPKYNYIDFSHSNTQESKSNAVVKTKKNKNGDYPLYLAAKSGNIELVRLLLAHGAKVNVTQEEPRFSHSYHKMTPFHIAVLSENISIVELLIQAKCKVNLKPKYEGSLMYIYRYAINLMTTVLENSRLFELLLKSGLNPNKKWSYPAVYRFGSQGRIGIEKSSPLHIAIAHEKFEVAKILLKYKADPNSKDSFGNTPLHIAAYISYELRTRFDPSQFTEIAQDLIKAGAKPCLKNKINVIPYAYAFGNMKEFLAQYL